MARGLAAWADVQARVLPQGQRRKRKAGRNKVTLRPDRPRRLREIISCLAKGHLREPERLSPVRRKVINCPLKGYLLSDVRLPFRTSLFDMFTSDTAS